MEPSIKSNTGGATIKRVGHTESGVHGNCSSKQRRGYPNQPTDITFGKGK